jgi:hypothetical protein
MLWFFQFRLAQQIMPIKICSVYKRSLVAWSAIHLTAAIFSPRFRLIQYLEYLNFHDSERLGLLACIIWLYNHTRTNSRSQMHITNWCASWKFAKGKEKPVLQHCSFIRWVKTPWIKSASELYRPRGRRLSAKLVPTFVDRECHVVSVTDSYCRMLGFVDRSRYFSSK